MKRTVKVVMWTLIAVVAITFFWTINRKGATLNVSETFFRYIFKNNISGMQHNAEAFFLEIEGKDPSPKLLARFKRYSPPVKKVSEYVSRERNGIKFRIDSYKWFGNIVVIRGGYYEGSMSASWRNYFYIQIAGRWFLIYASPMVVA